MKDHRRSSHSLSSLTAHIVWVTKYRYPVLTGDIQKRCRALLIQICDSEDVRILKGVVSKDHVHMHVEYPPKCSISNLVKRMKGRCSRRLQDEFPHLKNKYWGRHFWAIGYGVWSTGNITMKWSKNIWNTTEIHRMEIQVISSLSEDFSPFKQPMGF